MNKLEIRKERMNTIVSFLDKNGISNANLISNETNISKSKVYYFLDYLIQEKKVIRTIVDGVSHYYINNFYDIETIPISNEIKELITELVEVIKAKWYN